MGKKVRGCAIEGQGERDRERGESGNQGNRPLYVGIHRPFSRPPTRKASAASVTHNGFHGAFLSRWISLSIPAGGGNNLWNGKEGYGLVKGTSTKRRMRLSDKPPCSLGGRTHARGQCALILDPPIVGWLDLERVRNGLSRIMALDDATSRGATTDPTDALLPRPSVRK